MTGAPDGPPPAGESLSRTVVQPDKRALLNRVRRIEGQVAGLAAMLDNDRYCLDILTQVSAVKSALDGLAVQLLANHADGCLRRAIGASEADGDAAIAEVMEVIRRMIR